MKHRFGLPQNWTPILKGGLRPNRKRPAEHRKQKKPFDPLLGFRDQRIDRRPDDFYAEQSQEAELAEWHDDPIELEDD
jgi:hypothetical protein